MPVQVVYADDPSTSNDLAGEIPNLVVLKSLPQIKDKSTGFVGTVATDYVATARIKACDDGLEGKFKIEIVGGLPAEYKSREEFEAGPNEEKTIVLNPKTSVEGVSAIPFVPSSHDNVPGTSDITWEPLQFFEFKVAGTNEAGGIAQIKLKFEDESGDIECGETIVQKVIETVPFKVAWKGIVLPKDSDFDADRVQGEVESRSQISAFGGLPALAIKASYPVENPKFTPLHSQFVSTIQGLTRGFNHVDLSVWLQFPISSHRDLSQFVSGFGELWRAAAQADRLVLITQSGLLEIYKHPNAQSGPLGVNIGHSKVVLVEEDRSPHKVEPWVEAHEIGHSTPFKLSDDYISQNGQVTSLGFKSEGYLATVLEFQEPPRPVASEDKDITLGFMGSNPKGDRSDFISFDFQTVAKNHYRDIFMPRFDAATNTHVDPPVWLLRGILDRTGLTVSNLEVSPIYNIDGVPEEVAEECGSEPDCLTLKIKTTLTDDSVEERDLFVRAIALVDDDDEIPLDSVGFSDIIEVPSQGIKKITIEDTLENVLFEHTVTPNTPTLDILSVKVKNNKIEAKTLTSDADGDDLHASFFIETPDGLLELVLADEALSAPHNKFTMPLAGLLPGNYKAVIMVTDGFNTAREEAEFTIPVMLSLLYSGDLTTGDSTEVIPLI